MASKRWSARVTRTSNALDLDPAVFTLPDPDAIARSLKRSAVTSTRRKTDAFRSAMSMLTFYMNRAGRNLSGRRRATLERAKDALRREFGRAPAAPRTPVQRSGRAGPRASSRTAAPGPRRRARTRR